MAPPASSPPCAAPGQLLVSCEAATARNGCGAARVLAVARARAKEAARVWRKTPGGCGAAYKGREPSLACGLRTRTCARGGLGRRRDRTRGGEKNDLNQLKTAQAIEFKHEFEFKQPKAMLQHECNK
jgi:hypothetical protein